MDLDKINKYLNSTLDKSNVHEPQNAATKLIAELRANFSSGDVMLISTATPMEAQLQQQTDRRVEAYNIIEELRQTIHDLRSEKWAAGSTETSTKGKTLKTAKQRPISESASDLVDALVSQFIMISEINGVEVVKGTVSVWFANRSHLGIKKTAHSELLTTLNGYDEYVIRAAATKWWRPLYPHGRPAWRKDGSICWQTGNRKPLI